MRRLARHVQRAAALLVAALFWLLIVFVVTPCNAGTSTGTVYGNFQDVFGAGFNPQITWHPVALFIPTNEPTPLYKDRKIVPNSTNAAQSFFYARDGSFAISNLWTGSYIVYADGTDQSYNCYVQSGTWTFNQTLTNNQFPTNGGLVFVAGSNVTLIQLGNTVTISTSAVSDGGTVTNLTIVTNISQTIIVTNLTVVSSGSASNLTVTNNLDLPYIQSPAILQKGSVGITGIALDGTNSELFNGAGGFSILSPQFQMTLDGKMSLRPGFRATNIASVGGYQISDGGESSFDNSGIWDLENPNGSAPFYLGNSPNATNAQVYAGTFYGSFKVAGTLSGFPGATMQIGDIGDINPINNIHSTNAFTGNETVSNLFDLLGTFEVNNTNAPAGQVFTSLGSGNAAFRPAIGGGGSQTPWTNDINAAQHSLTNIESLSLYDNRGSRPPGLKISTDATTGYINFTPPSGQVVNINAFVDNDIRGTIEMGVMNDFGVGFIASPEFGSQPYLDFGGLASGNVTPNMQSGRATNFQGSSFSFLNPIGLYINPQTVNETGVLVSNTSGSSITASWPSFWSNNWQNGGGSLNINAHSIAFFSITVYPGVLTNISYSQAAGGSGTVTSVSGAGDGTIFASGSYGTVTTSGTLTLPTPQNESAKTIFAGPVSGSAAAPTFRALNQQDLPPVALTNGSTIQGSNVLFNTIGSGSGSSPTANMANGAVGTVGTNSQSGNFTFGAPINVNTSAVGAFSSFLINVTNTSGSPIVATGLSTWKTNAVPSGGWSITNDATFTFSVFYGLFTNVLYLPIN